MRVRAEGKEQELDEWRAEDKEYGLVCVCAELKTKRRNRLAH